MQRLSNLLLLLRCQTGGIRKLTPNLHLRAVVGMVVTEPELDGPHVTFTNTDEELGFREVIAQRDSIVHCTLSLCGERRIFLPPTVVRPSADADVLTCDGKAGGLLELGDEIRFLLGDSSTDRRSGIVSDVDFCH